MQILNILKKIIFITAATFMLACSGASGQKQNDYEKLPFTGDNVREHVVNDHGKRAIRADADKTISRPDLMRNKRNCFIVMSKKDFYVYVYEAQGSDTVMLARYDACFSLKKGNKQRVGDMKTPSSTMAKPFKITQMQPATSWTHDFRDGRGAIRSYGDWFLRLQTPGHSGIGIHGSTNNVERVPGRASEGCIRLLDKDIRDLHDFYAFVGMKVVIKDESIDDLPFEIKAMRRQEIERRRHFDPKKTLRNEQVSMQPTEKFAPNRNGGKKNFEDEGVMSYEEMYSGDQEWDNNDIETNVQDNSVSPNIKDNSKNKTLDEL